MDIRKTAKINQPVRVIAPWLRNGCNYGPREGAADRQRTDGEEEESCLLLGPQLERRERKRNFRG